MYIVYVMSVSKVMVMVYTSCLIGDPNIVKGCRAVFVINGEHKESPCFRYKVFKRENTQACKNGICGTIVFGFCD